MILWIPFMIILYKATSATTVTNGNLSLKLTVAANGINLEAYDGSTKKLEGSIGLHFNFFGVPCIGQETCYIDDFDFSVVPINSGFKIKWKTYNKHRPFEDCFELLDDVQWYGGPTIMSLTWPIQGSVISGTDPYIINNSRGFPYAERYWLNSLGTYLFVEDYIPLYVKQNDIIENRLCFVASIDDSNGPYFNRSSNALEYYIIFKSDPKEAHLHGVNKFLGKPSDLPNDKMVSEPIWTTWAKYKTAINDSTVLDFATQIRKNGYEKGQIEIDDNWERCYGAQEFSTTTFPNIKNTVKELKNMDFRVTLWIHPFVDRGCENVSQIGIEQDYFVKDKYGRMGGSWWNNNDSFQIDFTNSEASDWWIKRVNRLRQDLGFDSFKFDGGETDFSLQPAVYRNVNQNLIPNILTRSYYDACAFFGNLIEVRAGWRTQDLPIFKRMLDKDSDWGSRNGLQSFIITLLQMNMVGYTLVLPDMIGGNGYYELPDAELFVRWTQANIFMPSMQFSYLPWDYNDTKIDVAGITKKSVKLHSKYADTIIDAMKKSVQDGSPVNPPIWWIDPSDEKALKCNDEFLVGEEILVAPVIEKGAVSREIYLPKGRWMDGNNNSLFYHGPISINYSADITTLPYFILSNTASKTQLKNISVIRS